jgi:opacity protein-like surface antigen
MRTRVLQVAMMVSFSWLSLWAQEGTVPKAEVFATYSYYNIDGGNLIPRQSLNGWGFGFGPNLTKHLGITVQGLGAYGTFDESFLVQRTGLEITSADVAAHALLAGPEVSYRGPTFRLFAHGLAGFMNYRLQNLQINSGGSYVAVPDLGESETNFGWGVGGGVDMKISPIVAARIGQIDYLVENANPTRHHYRVAFGLVFSFGAL